MTLRIYNRAPAPVPPEDPFLTLDDDKKAPAPPGAADGYLEALSKLVPGEVATAYLVLVGLLPAAPKGGLLALWGVVAVLIILTPLYVLRRSHVEGKPPVYAQAALTTAVFVVWAFIIGGPFETLAWYDRFWGSLALVAISAAAPLIVRGFKANDM